MAHDLHVPDENFAKTVLVKIDGQPVVAVLQLPRQVNLIEIQQCFEAKKVVLAEENEFRKLFPDCEIGAVLPFGSIYGMKTIVDVGLTQGERIVFDGNTHEEAISMLYKDFDMIEHPHQGVIGILNAVESMS